MTSNLAGPLQCPTLASVRLLGWDTEFFGARMGVIELGPTGAASTPALAGAILDAIRAARLDRFEHLILRSEGADWRVTWAAERAGMRLVDVGVDLRACSLTGGLPEAPLCRPWHRTDVTLLREIAATSFTFSRFAVDPFFNREQEQAFHATWVTNLCEGLADQVLVAGELGAPLGFVSCLLSGDSGRIPLIAVAPHARGRGVGHQLMTAARAWFACNGAVEAWVKTQVQNHSALGLYVRHGFAPGRSELVFSIALHTEGAGGGRS